MITQTVSRTICDMLVSCPILSPRLRLYRSFPMPISKVNRICFLFLSSVFAGWPIIYDGINLPTVNGGLPALIKILTSINLSITNFVGARGRTPTTENFVGARGCTPTTETEKCRNPRGFDLRGYFCNLYFASFFFTITNAIRATKKNTRSAQAIPPRV